MKLKDITSFLCPKCYTWIKGNRCSKCDYGLKPGDSCKNQNCGSTLYDIYRPPRPLNMSPVQYYKIYGCVDDNFTRKTNGKYYCNPAHCSKSWIIKTNRDEHIKRAYAALD